MSSGRKRRVVISCVTFETVKITDPIAFYEATHVHLIWYNGKNPEEKSVFKDFYQRVCEIIHEWSPTVEITGHSKEPVYKFTNMLRTVLSIVQREKKESQDSDVYVNVSAGTSEYAAAAAMASMMTGAAPFSVGTETGGYMVKEDAYYENGKPVGLTKKAKEPYLMLYYPIDTPECHLVRALRALEFRNSKNLPTTGTKMVETLKKKGMWFRGEVNLEEEFVLDEFQKKRLENKRRTERKREREIETKGVYVDRSDIVYYHRDFVDKWVREGWVQKNEHNKYETTDAGKRILEIFYIDDDPDLMIDRVRK
jgi:hypothetical protein